MDSIKAGFSNFGKSASNQWARLRGQEPEEEDDGLISSLKAQQDEFCDTISLTRTQRFYGFGICFVCGVGLCILGIVLLTVIAIIPFAVCYSLGTILSICSSMFLFGPWYQLKNMMKPTRILATIIMFVFIILTLVAAIAWHSILLCALFAVCQCLACGWYCLSYIPYARALVSKCAGSCISLE